MLLQYLENKSVMLAISPWPEEALRRAFIGYGALSRDWVCFAFVEENGRLSVKYVCWLADHGWALLDWGLLNSDLGLGLLNCDDYLFADCLRVLCPSNTVL